MVKPEFPPWQVSLLAGEFLSLILRSRFSLPDSQSATGGAYISQLCKRELYGYQLDCHDVSMPQKKSKTQSDEATRASVRKAPPANGAV
jgi:hypothetical protein